MSYYQTIYNRLRAEGLTEAGALGFLGNWDCESNCEPFRLQGDFSPYKTASHQYTKDVEDGSIPMYHFAHDSKGYGLAQWTYFSRKEGLYDYWKRSGKALDDCEMQTDFALYELSTEGEYASVNQTVRTSNDLYECVSIICRQYERPYFNNIDPRFQAANRIKAEIDLNPQPVPPDPPEPPVPPVPPAPVGVYWPPRTIDFHCVDWPEVTVLGAILYCRGYLDYAAVAWNDDVTEAVKAFQKATFPGQPSEWDGCVGPATWSKLLSMGKG